MVNSFKKFKYMDIAKLNEIVKEFLKYNGYKSVLESLESEEKSKLATNKISKKNLAHGLKVVRLSQR